MTHLQTEDGKTSYVFDLARPVDRALVDIIEIFTKKNDDYADGADWASNFRDSARQTGVYPVTVADILIAVKQSRLRALAVRGRDPRNETLEDTYLDRAVYSVIALALLREEQEASRQDLSR